jgi:hypothetical protein
MTLSDIGKVPGTYGVPHAKHTALSVRWGKGEGRPTQSTGDAASEVQPSAGLRPEKVIEQNRTRLVRADENITVAPTCLQIVFGRLESEEHSLPLLICVEPAQIPIEEKLPARALSGVKSGAHEPSRAKSKFSCNKTDVYT